MKNFFFLFLLVTLFVILFLANVLYVSFKVDTTFVGLLHPSDKLSKRLVDNYFSEDDNLRKTSEDKIKKIVLNDTDYKNWLDYREYIEITLYPMDVINEPTEDLIVAVNISKDEGIIAIYRLLNDSYIYVKKIENLSYINSVSSIKTTSNKTFLIIEEILDERLGAFFIDHYLRIFSFKNTTFKEVFRQSLEYETYYFEKWLNPLNESPRWFKLTEKNLIDFVTTDDKKIVLNINKYLQKNVSFTGTNTIPDNFKLTNEKNLDIKYFWSDKYSYFIQGEGIKINGTIVGIIECSNQFVDSLLNLTEPYYKVIDKNGKIEYINQKKIKTIKYDD